MALPYIFVSRAMTPAATNARSLEQHYTDHRIILLTALMVPILTSMLFNIVAVTQRHEWSGHAVLGIVLYSGVRLTALGVMLFWPAPWVQRTGFLALAAYTVLLMF
jgi:predicted tellurium resistance membrane protein TerC